MHNIERIPLEGARNTRDLGGFPAADGRTVRARRLIRSGELSRLTERDKQILVLEYDLRQIIDFRTDVERAQSPDPELEGVHAVWNPILGSAALGITSDTGANADALRSTLESLRESGRSMESYMDGVYAQLVNSPAAQSQYARFFDLLLEQREGATLWHCSAGKDRVGVGTALVLSALGVDRELIVRDYLMTGAFAADEAERALSGAPEPLKAALREAFAVRESYIGAVFDAAQAQCGSMEAYLNEAIGLNRSRILALRSLYLS